MSKFFIADPGIAECAGAAGVAAQLRGRVGSSGLASARGREAITGKSRARAVGLAFTSFAHLARAREGRPTAAARLAGPRLFFLRMSKFFIADPGIAECAGAAGVAA